jgi:hypothetical protein
MGVLRKDDLGIEAASDELYALLAADSKLLSRALALLKRVEEPTPKTCKTCGKELHWKSRSGYCREHYANSAAVGSSKERAKRLNVEVMKALDKAFGPEAVDLFNAAVKVIGRRSAAVEVVETYFALKGRMPEVDLSPFRKRKYVRKSTPCAPGQ